jgi:hypothetical protein
VIVVGGGPKDNGRILDKLGKLEEEAQKRVVQEGRGGKGVVIVVPPGIQQLTYIIEW